MAIELAVALAAIATKTLVVELIRGTSMSRDTWADVGADIVGTLVSSTARSPAGTVGQGYHGDQVGHRFDRVGQRIEHVGEQVGYVGRKVDRVGEQVEQVGRKVDRVGEQVEQVGRKVERVGEQVNDLQARDFDRYMRAGSRYLRDLPVQWRTDQDRRELIRDARRSFVDAVAVAEQIQDTERQALAEVAIAGCWLWIPSIDDVRNTIGHARRILEHEILFGPTRSTEAYVDVVELCRAYGERPRRTSVPARWRWVREARLAVGAHQDMWVECAGVELKVIPTSQDAGGKAGPSLNVQPDEQVTVKIRNTRPEWISVSLTHQAVLVEIVPRQTPAGNCVESGRKATFTLARPATSSGTVQLRNRSATDIPQAPTIGFVLIRANTIAQR